jgi:hypothetical protein
MNNALNAIGNIDKGRAVIELDDAMTAVAKAVMGLRAKGEVTVKLTMKPAGDAMELACKITSKIPKPDLKPATFFVTEDGALTREDPNQPELPAVAKMA